MMRLVLRIVPDERLVIMRGDLPVSMNGGKHPGSVLPRSCTRTHWQLFVLLAERALCLPGLNNNGRVMMCSRPIDHDRFKQKKLKVAALYHI